MTPTSPNPREQEVTMKERAEAALVEQGKKFLADLAQGMDEEGLDREGEHFKINAVLRHIAALEAQLEQSERSAKHWCEVADVSAKEAMRLEAEVKRLTASLKSANEGFEKYERLYYLERDDVERKDVALRFYADLENWKWNAKPTDTANILDCGCEVQRDFGRRAKAALTDRKVG